jgi:hypothetical protein
MARCNFCGGTFINAQAVRAHLKTCPAYRRTRPTRPAPRHNQMLEDERQLDRLFASGGTSRQVPRASVSDVPEPRSVPRPDSRPPHTPTAEEFRRLQQARDEARRQAQVNQQERATRVRALIQHTKLVVIDFYCAWPPVPSAAIAEAKEAIERKLLTLPLLELPLTELQQIGTGVRDTIYDRHRAPAGAAPVPPTSLITSNPLPTQEVIMPKRKVVSGYFECPLCEEEYELDRVPESEAVCEECHVKLVEVADDDGE